MPGANSTRIACRDLLRRSDRFSGFLQQAAHRFRRLRALGDPSVGFFKIHLDVVILHERIVSANDFQKAPVSGHTLICGYDAVKRAVLRAFSAESQYNHDACVRYFLIKWAAKVRSIAEKSSANLLLICRTLIIFTQQCTANRRGGRVVYGYSLENCLSES